MGYIYIPLCWVYSIAYFDEIGSQQDFFGIPNMFPLIEKIYNSIMPKFKFQKVTKYRKKI